MAARAPPSTQGRVAHRHDQVQEVRFLGLGVSVRAGHYQAGLEGLVELEYHFLRVYRRDAIQQVSRVEGDEELVLARRRQTFVGLPYLPVAHDHLDGALGEGQAHRNRRRLALGEEVDAPQSADQIFPVHRDLALEARRQKTPVLREVSVYEPRGEEDV